MIKELAKCIGEYKKDTILSPLFVGLEVVMEVLIPLLMADLIDKGISAGAMDYIIKIGIVLVVMALISLLFGALSGAFAARAMAGFGKNLRGRMFRRIQDYSFGNIDRFSAAGLITRLTTDVTNVQGAFMMIIRIAVRAPLMLIMALVCAFAINAGLSLVFLVAIPVLGIGLYYIMVKTFPVFMKVFKTYDNLNNDVEENLRAVRVVKAFVREKHETEKFNKVSGELYDYAVTAEKILALTNPLMMFVIYLCMLLIAWFGAHLIVSGSMTTGELVSMITYVMQILMSLMMLSLVFVMITMSRASALRITEVLQEVPDVSNPKNPALEVKDGSIEFDDVSFGYSRDKTEIVDCLKHINFKIPSGATVGILGNTGSAKSSLVQLIPRLYDVSSGCVKVGGRDVREYDLKVLRDAVAMVLQNNVLFTGTVRGNLCWGNENATDEQIKEVCRIACIDKYIESLPLAYDSRVEQEGANFSGGQKQRLCIARALLKAPRVLIMDDSTSAVDMQTDAMIRKSFRESLPETTKLVIAQRVSSVEESDLIIVLDEGEILAMGTHDELMDSCVAYRETAISQMKGGE